MRLDEPSARKIVIGRLALFSERLSEQELGERPKKPNAQLNGFTAYLRKTFGHSLLAEYPFTKRMKAFVIAYPHPDKPGWIQIGAVKYNTRRLALNRGLFFSISAHAAARLLERRGDVEIERILSEEFSTITLETMVKISKEEIGETIQTKNGAFRMQKDSDYFVAVTWIKEQK